MIRLEFPFATPSSNQWQKWHFGKRRKWCDVVTEVVVVDLYNRKIPTPYSARPVVAAHRRAACAVQDCAGVPLTGPDERKVYWCGEHTQGRPRYLKSAVTITRHSAGELDYDRFVGGAVGLVDVLASVGLVVDDCRRWIDVKYVQSDAKRGEGRTVVEIEVME